MAKRMPAPPLKAIENTPVLFQYLYNAPTFAYNPGQIKSQKLPIMIDNENNSYYIMVLSVLLYGSRKNELSKRLRVLNTKEVI